VEALARSQTLMEMRNPPGMSTPSMTLGEQAEMFPVHSSGVPRTPAKERYLEDFNICFDIYLN